MVVLEGGDPLSPCLPVRWVTKGLDHTKDIRKIIHMALSDTEFRSKMPSVRRRAIARKRGHWSDSQKLEAVQSYLILGNLKLVSGALKIPYATLRLWKSSEWWKQIIEDLKIQEDLQLSTRLKKIITKSYDVIEDRMENGDFVFDQKTGEMRRKPVGVRDATEVARQLEERREKAVERHMGEKTITEDKIEKTLASLAEQFAKIANQVNTNKPSTEVVDVIFGKDHAEEK
jgi:hypothetical protein